MLINFLLYLVLIEAGDRRFSQSEDKERRRKRHESVGQRRRFELTNFIANVENSQSNQWQPPPLQTEQGFPGINQKHEWCRYQCRVIPKIPSNINVWGGCFEEWIFYETIFKDIVGQNEYYTIDFDSSGSRFICPKKFHCLCIKLLSDVDLTEYTD